METVGKNFGPLVEAGPSGLNMMKCFSVRHKLHFPFPGLKGLALAMGVHLVSCNACNLPSSPFWLKFFHMQVLNVVCFFESNFSLVWPDEQSSAIIRGRDETADQGLHNDTAPGSGLINKFQLSMSQIMQMLRLNIRRCQVSSRASNESSRSFTVTREGPYQCLHLV